MRAGSCVETNKPVIRFVQAPFHFPFPPSYLPPLNRPRFSIDKSNMRQVRQIPPLFFFSPWLPWPCNVAGCAPSLYSSGKSLLFSLFLSALFSLRKSQVQQVSRGIIAQLYPSPWKIIFPPPPSLRNKLQFPLAAGQPKVYSRRRINHALRIVPPPFPFFLFPFPPLLMSFHSRCVCQGGKQTTGSCHQIRPFFFPFPFLATRLRQDQRTWEAPKPSIFFLPSLPPSQPLLFRRVKGSE